MDFDKIVETGMRTIPYAICIGLVVKNIASQQKITNYVNNILSDPRHSSTQSKSFSGKSEFFPLLKEAIQLKTPGIILALAATAVIPFVFPSIAFSTAAAISAFVIFTDIFGIIALTYYADKVQNKQITLPKDSSEVFTLFINEYNASASNPNPITIGNLCWLIKHTDIDLNCKIEVKTGNTDGTQPSPQTMSLQDYLCSNIIQRNHQEAIETAFKKRGVEFSFPRVEENPQ